MVVQTPGDTESERVRLVFRVGPKNIMANFMVIRVHPSPFRVVLSSVFPVFRVNQIDLAVLISLFRGFTPIDVFKPVHFGGFQMVKAAKERYGSFKILSFILMEKG